MIGLLAGFKDQKWESIFISFHSLQFAFYSLSYTFLLVLVILFDFMLLQHIFDTIYLYEFIITLVFHPFYFYSMFCKISSLFIQFRLNYL